jgi:hypothetical protein
VKLANLAPQFDRLGFSHQGQGHIATQRHRGAGFEGRMPLGSPHRK